MKAIAAALLLTAASCAFAQDFSKVEVKATKLNETTCMLTGAGGNLGLSGACDQVLALASDTTRIIPGHGPLSNKAELNAYRDMVATVSARVKEMVAAGRKADEIFAAGVTKDFDEKWGKGFIKPDKFVEMLAAEVAKSR